MSSQYPQRTHSRAETPLPPPPPLRERGDSGSSQPIAGSSTSSHTAINSIQIPSSINSTVRTSPQKAQIRTYDSKLISREMDRLAMNSPTPPIHSHSHSHSHTGTPHALHAQMATAGSISTLSLVPNASAIATSPSVSLASDDPWSVLHLHVLPLFNGEPIRMPIEDLNALAKRHLQTVVSKSPSRAITTLENDLIDLLSTGMITLNAKLNGVDDEKLLNRVVELWGFFWTQLLPYVEGVFLPLQMDQLLVSLSRTPKVVRSTSPVESTDRDNPPSQSTLMSAPIDVRTLTLRSFRDAIILPIFERLHILITSPKGKEGRKEYNEPRFQQMLLVLTSIQTPSASLSMSEPPLSPGEHAITHLLRAARNPNSGAFPLNPYPNAQHRRRTMGPSSFSGGAPRDRRGRIARRDDAFDEKVLGLIPGPSVDDTPRASRANNDPNETPTINGLKQEADIQHIQRLREEKQFLDSLKSPDLDAEMEKNDPTAVSNGQFANVVYDYDSASEEEDFGNEIPRNGAPVGEWEQPTR